MDENLFGITMEYIESLYNQIFDFVFYSEGAFTFTEVKSWPIWLRTHYINRLSKILKERSEEMRKANNRSRRR